MGVGSSMTCTRFGVGTVPDSVQVLGQPAPNPVQTVSLSLSFLSLLLRLNPMVTNP